MKSSFDRVWQVTILIICLLLINCATTRIDVDVYKGPLANHQDIQLQELVVMAIAAKPLLIQLRDSLEWGAEASEIIQNISWYKSEYVPPDIRNGKFKSRFKGQDAERVNAILYLYENQEELLPSEAAAEAAALLRDGLQIYSRFIEALNILRPLNQANQREANKALWAKISKKMRTRIAKVERSELKKALELTNEGFKRASTGNRWDEIGKKINSLKKAYQGFIEANFEGSAARGYRDQRKIFEADNHLRRLIFNLNYPNKKFRQKEFISANEQFETIAKENAEGGILENHADILYPFKKRKEIEVAKSFFITKTRKIAQSFLDARSQIDRLLKLSLTGILVLHDPSAPENVKINDLRLVAANLSAVLINPSLLYKALEILSIKGVKEAKDLKNELGKKCHRIKYQDLRNLRKPNQDFIDDLMDILASNSGENARRLLTVQIEFRKYGLSPAKNQYMFGVAIGPRDPLKEDNIERGVDQTTLESAINLVKLESAISNLGDVSQFGFERGRLPEGLDSLITNYLKLSEKFAPEENGDEDDELVKARRVLFDALVRFSVKVLELADNSELIETGGAGTKGFNKYVAVLQSIGNSIQIQADELKFRNSHKQELEKRYQAEVNALKRVYFLDARGVFNQMTEVLQGDASIQDNRIQQLTTEIGELEESMKGSKKKLSELGSKEKKEKLITETYSLRRQADELNIERINEIINDLKRLLDEIDQLIALVPDPTIDEKKLKSNVAKARLVDVYARSVESKAEKVKKMVQNIGQNSRKLIEISAQKLNTEQRAVIENILEPVKHLDSNFKVFLDELEKGKKEAEKTRKVYQCIRKLTDAAVKVDKSNEQCKKQDGSAKTIAELRGELENDIKNALMSLSKTDNIIETESKLFPTIIKNFKDRAETNKLEEKNKTALNNLKPIKAEKSKIEKRLREKRNQKKAKEAVKKNAQTLKAELTTAIKAVDGYEEKLIEKFGRNTVESTEVIQYLINEMAQDDAKRRTKELDRTIAIIRERKSNIVSIGAIDTKHQNTKYVLDQLITTLKYLYIKAVETSGANSSGALKLKDAIDAANAYRSGMVYIRPASSYLRSSYAATSLQDDPGLLWKNMLGGHAMRGLPIIGESIYNEAVRKISPEKAKIISEIDKQFWQNINSVRVSGAGNTNYVIAKDDIGNWYVKNYSADPAPIIRGAESLAAFAMGDVLQTDLLSRVQAAREGQTARSTAATDMTGLSNVLTRFESEYVEDTRNDLVFLIGRLKSTDPDAADYASPLTNTIKEQLFLKPAIKDKHIEVSERLNIAANNTLKAAVDEMENARVKKEAAGTTIDDIKRSVSGGENRDIIPLLDNIKKDIDNPKRNARIMDSIDSSLVKKDDERLNQNLADLRKYLGDPDQGSIIINGLQSARRFHNRFYTLLDNINFTEAPLDSLIKKEQELTLKQNKKNAAKTELDNINAVIEDENATKEERKAAQEKLEAAQEELLKASIAEIATGKAVEAAKEASKNAKNVAQSILTTIVKSFLDQMLDKRRRTINHYEERVVFLGEVAE